MTRQELIDKMYKALKARDYMGASECKARIGKLTSFEVFKCNRIVDSN